MSVKRSLMGLYVFKWWINIDKYYGSVIDFDLGFGEGFRVGRVFVLDFKGWEEFEWEIKC